MWRDSEGIGQAFPLCMGGGREAWLDLLLVCGRESEGHRSDLFLLYVGRESPGCTCCLCVGGIVRGIGSDLFLVYGGGRVLVVPVLVCGGIVRGIGQTFPCVWEGESPGWTCCLCGRDSEGHRSDLFLVYGGGRVLVYLLLVCGKESEGHRSDLFPCVWRERGWLDLLLVCGKDSEGHRSDLFLVYGGRERGLVGPVACVREGE